MAHLVVTGGAGFIGSHIADAFVERGWRVTVIDNLSTGDRANVNKGATLIEHDLRDASTSRLIGDLEPDVVSHQAAQVDLRKSVTDPGSDADINITASIRLLQASLDAGVKRFVFASSGGAIYGEPLFAPQNEEHRKLPLSPYGCAKFSVEHYLTYFREVHGLSSMALRYANVYGPRQSATGEAGVVAIFAGRLLRGQPVVINGSGEQTRDFVNVADVVRANVFACQSQVSGEFNVGTGIETSVNELYAKMSSIAGVQADAKHGDAKTGEQIRSVLDGSRLRSIASLPEPIDLAAGLAGTIDFFRDRVTSS
jgi:UDP-glucose 4-epimerase